MSKSGTYDPKAIEAEIYRFWEGAGHFQADPDPRRRPFTIVIPPPNVTGALHLGHAINNTLQDVLIRRKRMQGFNACWLPGTDHAGIATQAVVERRLREEQGWRRDPANPEHRSFLVEKIWTWKEEYNARILDQLRAMGCSCDWRRTRFTLDEGCANAVYETFFRMFRDGLIYRGLRLVNWDTQLQTAVADDEVYHETVKGHLWHVRYPILEGSGSEDSASGAGILPANSQPGRDYLIVATTRPETMLADTAVAVHPEDERYRHLIGKRVLLPLVNKPIPIIADPILVNREFGTGVVKVTPGHDPNDYACAQRNGLSMPNMMTPDGRIAPLMDIPGKYVGLPLDAARKEVVADLEAAGLLERVEPYETEIGHSDRSKTPIQPYLSEQWFVKMDKLADLAMEAVRDGRVRFFPERYAKTYLDWLREKRDWCISRQLWWGHRIPVWRWPPEPKMALSTETLGELKNAIELGLVACNCRSYSQEFQALLAASSGRTSPDATAQLRKLSFCPKPSFTAKFEALAAALSLEQDPDVLDTWFSSALWPHSTFGWPPDNDDAGVADLNYFYPTNVLCTARDIITLWVARMVMTGLYNTGRVPFPHVYIHPVIQDGHGRRMSKSAGNGVDPLDLIEMYGADAMRFTLAGMGGETQDVRVPVKPVKTADGRTINTSERFELGRNFCNKLWQAATGYILPNVRDVRIEKRALVDPQTRKEGEDHTSRAPGRLPLFDRWIRTRLLACIKAVDDDLENYRFAHAADELRTFFWSEFCDWYIEESKARLTRTDADPDEANDVKVVLLQTLDLSLCLLHPFIPFVTEEIWQRISAEIPRHHELIWPEEGGAAPLLPEKPPPLIRAPWPLAWADAQDKDALAEVAERIQPVIRTLRDIRAGVNGIRAQARETAIRTLPAAVVRTRREIADALNRHKPAILRLAQVDALEIGTDVARPPESASKVLPGIEVYVPLTGLADLGLERARLRKERDEVAGAIERLVAKLSSDGFVAGAPPAVVERERIRLAELKEKATAIDQNLAQISG